MIRAAAVADDTVLIEGPHGVGKSDAVKQVGIEDGYHVETLFLSTQDVGDLVGIPHMISKNGVKITTWSVPVWLNRMNDAAAGGKKCILFLDELNRAAVDIRQAALQLVLERKLHEHALPMVSGERTLVVAAVNPSDGYQVDELDPALLDRFLNCTVDADPAGWLRWARGTGINQVIRNFVSEHPNRLHYTPADGTSGPTPRSWSKLSNYMNASGNMSASTMFNIFTGKLGLEVAAQFHAYVNKYQHAVKATDVIACVKTNMTDGDIVYVADHVRELLTGQEAVQLNELLEQLQDIYTESADHSDMLPVLATLYATEIEICTAFLKRLKTSPDAYTALVALDNELTGKKLFKRIVNAASAND